MKQLKATDVLASKQVMLIARSLMKLLETFGDGHKGRFLDHVNSRLGISKSSYYYYMEHYAFMSKVSSLKRSDFYSEHYWMGVDDEMDDDDMNVLNEHNSTAVENLRNK
ncbi:hypothetical protein BDEG_27476 [Batrachochytrium dendrobatidis JEL423]|uniref:Uncharacterized protein n=1 Tax=Batrachochytrium dendrobatidis (strain JEL423) TaxID=403673 RepID=A0A177WWF5_BATDL|nr:hypothetical protein BDEG_27476 [Batrachochytrium dendrobatidis JEL423]